MFVNSPGSVLNHTWIGYGGYWTGAGQADLTLNTSDVTVQNSVFASSYNRGVYIAALDPAHPLQLTGNTFLNNAQWAVYAKPTGSWADVTLTDNSSSGSPWNGFGLAGVISGTVSFSTPASFPFIANQEVAVAAGATLTVTPGTAFKLKDALTVNGRLLARGTVANPIVFTSYYDDAHGGDTDGGTGSAAPGDWIGLVINSPGSVLEHAWIGYGGHWCGPGYANLTINASDVSVQDSVLTQSSNRGIAVVGAAPTILANQIFGNQAGIYTANGALPLIRGNEIRNNSEAGVLNTDLTLRVDAASNWWGSTSGPLHPAANPAGTGNRVSDGVDFVPWYSEFAWLGTLHLAGARCEGAFVEGVRA
jgi:parallel beta-helix repeat protein